MATPTRSLPNPAWDDAHRRARVQEWVAVGLAAGLLLATSVASTRSVADGIAPPASRTERVVEMDPSTTGSYQRCTGGVPILVIADHAGTTLEPGLPNREARSIAFDRICPFGTS